MKNRQRGLLFLLSQVKFILIVIMTILLSVQINLLTNISVTAQIIRPTISPTDVWEKVYEELPNLPKENQYISKETGKPAINNTLVGRLIRYHVYLKGRTPIYRLDWKLTLADYLDANETMYPDSYPSSQSLTENPLVGDRLAISKLSRSQRNEFIEVLINIFYPQKNN